MALADVMAEVRTLRSFTKEGPLSEVDPYTLAVEPECNPSATASPAMDDSYYSYMAQKRAVSGSEEHCGDMGSARDSNDTSPLYNCPKDVNSSITLNTKAAEHDPGFKGGSSGAALVSSDATVCGSDNGDYPVIFEEDKTQTLQDPPTFSHYNIDA